MQSYTTYDTTLKVRHDKEHSTNMLRNMLLQLISEADKTSLEPYYKAYLAQKKGHYPSCGCRIDNTKVNNNEKEGIKMETTKLYDYKDLVQYDAEAESMRLDEDAPNVLDFLAYAVSKHEYEADLGATENVNEKALYTLFYMAMAAGYEKALKEEK